MDQKLKIEIGRRLNSIDDEFSSLIKLCFKFQERDLAAEVELLRLLVKKFDEKVKEK